MLTVVGLIGEGYKVGDEVVITEDHTRVVSGVFRVYETLGIPLEIILDELNKNNLQISWMDFIQESMNAGRKKEKVLATCKSAICEVYGHEYYEQWSHRLKVG